MRTPNPIESDYVPYNKRPVLLGNAGLLVDGGKSSRQSRTRVVPSAYYDPCHGRRPCSQLPDGRWCDSRGYVQDDFPPDCWKRF